MAHVIVCKPCVLLLRGPSGELESFDIFPEWEQAASPNGLRYNPLTSTNYGECTNPFGSTVGLIHGLVQLSMSSFLPSR